MIQGLWADSEDDDNPEILERTETAGEESI